MQVIQPQSRLRMRKTRIEAKMDKIRRHYVFFGDVQGVGFRYRAYHAAAYYGISGWVKNCYDGSVELEAEGTPKEIDDMLLAIEKGHYIRIEDFRVREIPLRNSHSFEIR